MIKYNLKCTNKHEFESWFADSKEFERLKLKKMIKCAFCGVHTIQKSIMSPSVLNKEKNIKFTKKIKKIRKDLIKMKNFVEKNFEYVGEDFPKEVRNIYYDNRKNKNIYGKATAEEAEDLKEEGIEVATIPWPDTNKDN